MFDRGADLGGETSSFTELHLYFTIPTDPNITLHLVNYLCGSRRPRGVPAATLSCSIPIGQYQTQDIPISRTNTIMAFLRRKNTLSPDSQTTRFLYTIIKQLDLKSVDWSQVATSLDITNGHAARMRFTRFKQQMEGVTSQPKTSRAGGKKAERREEG